MAADDRLEWMERELLTRAPPITTTSCSGNKLV